MSSENLHDLFPTRNDSNVVLDLGRPFFCLFFFRMEPNRTLYKRLYRLYNLATIIDVPFKLKSLYNWPLIFSFRAKKNLVFSKTGGLIESKSFQCQPRHCRLFSGSFRDNPNVLWPYLW